MKEQNDERVLLVKNVKISTLDDTDGHTANMLFRSQSFRQKMLGQQVGYVLGDLHGNVIKLLTFLSVTGHIHISPKLYNSLSCAYYANHLSVFIDLLSHIQWKSNTQAHLVLLGDTLSDRGKSDYMMLLIFERMHRYNVPFKVIFSNHDSFLLFCYLKNNFMETPWFGPTESWDYPRLDQKGQDYFRQCYELCYLPHLVLMDYEVIDKTIVLYTHAPFSVVTFHGLCLAMGISDDLNDGINCEIIHKLNAAFLNEIKGQSHEMVQTLKSKDSPINQFIWNTGSIWLPEPTNDTAYYNIHGHIGDGKHYPPTGMVDHAAADNDGCCIDTDMGKYYLSPDDQMRICKIRSSIPTQVKLIHLVDPIIRAQAKYSAWYRKEAGSRQSPTIGWFHRHGWDGQRRAAYILEAVKQAQTHKQVYGVLAKYANGHIRFDSQGQPIGGNPGWGQHSFLAFLLNEFKAYPPLAFKLGMKDLSKNNDYHQSHANQARKMALVHMKTLAPEWPSSPVLHDIPTISHPTGSMLSMQETQGSVPASMNPVSSLSLWAEDQIRPPQGRSFRRNSP